MKALTPRQQECPTCHQPISRSAHGGIPKYCSVECRLAGCVQRGNSDECWPWTVNSTPEGYGSFHLGKGKYAPAHRIAWTVANSREIPPGMMICHTCDNPPCCNPAHLFLGTNQENVSDMVRKGRKKSLRGTAHPNARLSDEDIQFIRANKSAGTAPALAEKFSVHKSHIINIWNGHRRGVVG